MKFFEKLFHPKYEKNVPEVKLSQKEIEKQGQEAYDLELRRAVARSSKGAEAKKFAEKAREQVMNAFIRKAETATEEIQKAQAKKQGVGPNSERQSRETVAGKAGEYEYKKALRETKEAGFNPTDIKILSEMRRGEAEKRVAEMDVERRVRAAGDKAYSRALREAVGLGLNPVEAKEYAEAERKNAEDTERAV